MKVRYNGGKDSYTNCSEPTGLVVGRVYEVESLEEGRWQTNYKLVNHVGEFNSAWFDELEVHMAISHHIPRVGERYRCKRLKFEFDAIKSELVITSLVEQVIYLGSHKYQVTTRNSIYIVNVMD